MDAIGSSTKIIWVFVFILGVPVILLIFSAIVWTYNRYRRLSFVAYIANIVLTLFILVIDVANLVTDFPWGDNIYNLCIWSLISFVVGIGCLVISIIYYCKNKAISNTFINISTALSVIVWFILLKMTNM